MGRGALGVQFIFVRRQQRNCTFNQDFYQFASADGAKTKPIVAVTGWGFKCSNATVRARCAYIPGVPPAGTRKSYHRLIRPTSLVLASFRDIADKATGKFYPPKRTVTCPRASSFRSNVARREKKPAKERAKNLIRG